MFDWGANFFSFLFLVLGVEPFILSGFLDHGHLEAFLKHLELVHGGDDRLRWMLNCSG